MWLKGVKTPMVLFGNCDDALSVPAALSLFIATVKILDFQMNALSRPSRAKRVYPY